MVRRYPQRIVPGYPQTMVPPEDGTRVPQSTDPTKHTPEGMVSLLLPHRILASVDRGVLTLAGIAVTLMQFFYLTQPFPTQNNASPQRALFSHFSEGVEEPFLRLSSRKNKRIF